MHKNKFYRRRNENDIEKTKKEVDIKTGIKANNTKSKEGKKTDSMSEKTLEKNKSEKKSGRYIVFHIAIFVN